MGNQDKKEKKLEDLFQELEVIMNDIKKEESLETSFQMYHEGIELIKKCNDKIDAVEKKMLVLDEGGEEHEF